MKALVATFLLTVASAFTGCARPSEPVARETRLVMGTTAEIEVQGLADPGPALAAAFAALARIDETLSLWRPSELQKLNDAGQGIPSRALREVLEKALELAEASGGGFDPTVEPIVRAEGGFGTPPHALSGAERAALLAHIGYRRVHQDPSSGRIRLEPGTRLDFGGIAKGYAVDQAIDALRSAGAITGVVSLGESSLGLLGTTLDLEVRDPEAGPGEPGKPWAVFHAENSHVSTSGTGQKGPHILDPRTGQAAGGVLSVTVLAASGAEADGLSTAAFVLGAGPGLRLIEKRGAAGFVLLRESGAPVVRTTNGFVRMHGLVPAEGVTVREEPEV